MNHFKGTGVAIVTPFNENLTIDFSAYERLINHTIGGGADYIVVLGTTGESVTLAKDEKKKLVEFTLEKVNKRVPVVVGVGTNDTADVINSLKLLVTDGVAGVLSVSPYYNKPSQKGIYEHYKATALETDLPVIIYNVPGRTGSNIAIETTISLAEDFKNIVATKEASGNLSQIMQIIKYKPTNFNVLSGDDSLSLPMISLGAMGSISVIGNSHPREFTSLINSALDGNFEKAREIQYKLINYMDALFVEGSPAGIKAALEIIGICKNVVRLPITTVTPGHYVKLQELINNI